jgi:hypothetical protein
VGSFPGFGMDTIRACFHADGKYYLRRTALNTFVRKVRWMSQDPVRNTVRTRSLANYESPDGL